MGSVHALLHLIGALITLKACPQGLTLHFSRRDIHEHKGPPNTLRNQVKEDEVSENA
jgi:hypothetical protein